jgi:hypothetical protein
MTRLQVDTSLTLLQKLTERSFDKCNGCRNYCGMSTRNDNKINRKNELMADNNNNNNNNTTHIVRILIMNFFIVWAMFFLLDHQYNGINF